MRLDPYSNKDSYRVVLSDSERQDVRDRIENTDSQIAWRLASCSGLRRKEIAHVRYKDVHQRETGDWILRVWEDGAKRDKYRETPIPSELAIQVNTIQETAQLNTSKKVIDHTMKTVERHIKSAAEEIAEERERMKGGNMCARTMDDVPGLTLY